MKLVQRQGCRVPSGGSGFVPLGAGLWVSPQTEVRGQSVSCDWDIASEKCQNSSGRHTGVLALQGHLA